MAGQPVPRSCTYSKEFDRRLADLDPDLPRREEVLRGVEWALARFPQLGLVRVRARLGSNGPSVDIGAVVEDRHVTIESISIVIE